MEIKVVVTGYLEENCYLIIKNNKVLVVDPGDDYERIMEVISNKEVIGILITHNHFDHVGALKYFDKNIPVIKKDNVDEGLFKIDDFEFKIIFTFGHTDDSITFYFEKEKIMFTGDFLFKEEIGRCDLPTGNFTVMLNSLRKIIKYGEDIIVYPGHGDKTTIGYEKSNNKYILNLEE